RSGILMHYRFPVYYSISHFLAMVTGHNEAYKISAEYADSNGNTVTFRDYTYKDSADQNTPLMAWYWHLD
ncbi:MAG: hypothetical protein WAK50_01690, partial [Nitrososphaeraceae archaeon]